MRHLLLVALLAALPLEAGARPKKPGPVAREVHKSGAYPDRIKMLPVPGKGGGKTGGGGGLRITIGGGGGGSAGISPIGSGTPTRISAASARRSFSEVRGAAADGLSVIRNGAVTAFSVMPLPTSKSIGGVPYRSI